MADTPTEAIEARARELWEDAEVRRLSSPWTTPTSFAGEVRKRYIAEALRLSAPQEPASFKQEWRCINCKLVVESLIEPHCCDECGQAHFASIVTLGAQEPVVDDDGEWLREFVNSPWLYVADREHLERIADRLQAKVPETDWPADAIFQRGAQAKKKGRASWRGTVVGWYRTELTALGFVIESAFEPGSVQVYPQSALEPWQAPETGEAE